MIFVKDILLDDDGDLLISNGDFTIGYSDSMHQMHIIEAPTGSYKEYPLVGVGIFQYVNSAGEENKIKQEIQIQLEDDKYLVNKVKITTSKEFKISIDAERIS